MSNVQIFQNDLFEVAVMFENGEVAFNAYYIAKNLGFVQKKNDIEYIRWERINKYLSEIGFPQLVGKDDFIPESAVYYLALKGETKKAIAFQKWVAMEVIPSIRKSGSYDVVPQSYAEALRLAANQAEKIEKLEFENYQSSQLIEELKPWANYTEIILKSRKTVTITQIAKDYGMSAKEMNKLLHELGIQYKQSGQWMLYDKYSGMGYTHSDTHKITRIGGFADVAMYTKWTQKGRLFIYDTLKSRKYVPIVERDMLEK